MATAEQVQEWRALRGRFLNASWDAENEGERLVPLARVITDIGAGDLADHQVERLVRNLRDDRLITESTSMGFDLNNESAELTSYGRYEVEQWLAEPDKPTEHLTVPANQVYSIGTMNVTGTVMQGSTATNVTTNVGVPGGELVKLVAQFRELLASAELSRDDREELEADLEVIEGEATAAQPRLGRLGPFLRRLKAGLVTGTLSGIEAGTKQEVIQLIEQAQQLPRIPG